jgi:hypothetical protein
MMRLVALIIFLSATLAAAQQPEPSTLVRFIRAYGGTNEQAPPIVLMRLVDDPSVPGYPFATIEFDVSASNIPNVYARMIHCNADWTEDENGFLNDVLNRTSLFDWGIAPSRSKYYTYRAKLQIPNPQIQLRFSGNWKVKIYDMETDLQLAEARIFVVDPQAFCRFNFMTDFYEPRYKVSAIALTLEAVIDAPQANLIDALMHSVVFYRNHRWGEPFMVSNKYDGSMNPYGVGTAIVGIFPAGKVFRVSRIPAQNEYRVLDLTNLALFPFTGQPVRLPLSDLRRNGSFWERSDDGAMITTMVPSSDDEYVPLEFLLDPQPSTPSEQDVFVVGSFNNWTPSREWMLFYDETLRLYRLRQWVRRGRHNYMYATGNMNATTGHITDVNFEEWEGNTASASNSYIAFAYYRVQDYGGYDGIVAVGASNIYRSGR